MKEEFMLDKFESLNKNADDKTLITTAIFLLSMYRVKFDLDEVMKDLVEICENNRSNRCESLLKYVNSKREMINERK